MQAIVYSPRDRWRPIHTIYDSGDDGFSIVIGFWDDKPVITGRWNGAKDSKGMPLSSGYAVPFVFPHFTWDAIVGLPEISDNDRELARSFLRLNATRQAA